MAKRPFQLKNIGGTLKDVDVSKRTVCGYFASFNTLDSDGDVFAPGAFKVSLAQNKDRIMHLLQHDTELPLARPSVLNEDNTGLYFESYFQPSKGDARLQYIQDSLEMYECGLYKEHSVGFELLKSKPDQNGDFDTYTNPWDPDKELPANIITEAFLWEGSTVTWGANKNTPFLGVKGDNIDEILKHISARKDLITKNLHRGNMMDETYIRLEKELKALNTLTAVDPAQASQPANVEELFKKLQNLNQFLQ